jgi:molecular chaperone GrpE
MSHKEHSKDPQEHAAGEAPATDLQKQLDAKTHEAADLLDQLKRVAAEYSNYQKRMQRLQDEEKSLAVRGLVLDLLGAVDDLDRALAAARMQPKYETLLEGVTLAHSHLLAALGKHGVVPIDVCGAAFDPEHHEAIACLPSDLHAEGKIMEQVQRGYQLNGRTIRPARVAVSGGPAKPDERAANEDLSEPQS